MNAPRKHRPVPAQKVFIGHLMRSFAVSMAILTFSLGIGVLGYHGICDLPWIDAFLNASMILTGMGPVNVPATDAGKLFASTYALFSGLAFLTLAAVLFAPVIHRFLHKFHLDIDDKNEM